MRCFYELVRGHEGCPYKAFIHSVGGLDIHWHTHMEIILVLEGSVNIRVGNEQYLLRENDLIVINSNEIHNTYQTEEPNILLALQVDTEHYSTYYPDLNKTYFECKSFLAEDIGDPRLNLVRHYLARIVWETNKKGTGYQLTVASQVNLLLAHLVTHFKDHVVEEEKAIGLHRDIARLQNIVSYINENLTKKITLKELAQREQLNFYYLSHFIKEKLGISFRDLLNIFRVDKAADLLLNSSATIIDIAYDCGYSSIKSFNKSFKDIFGCTPSQFRLNNNPKAAECLTEAGGSGNGARSRTYLDVDRKAAIAKLYSYLNLETNVEQRDNVDIIPSSQYSISADLQGVGKPFVHYWKKLITFTRAAEGLREGWRKQLEQLQEETGFEYIRFHGIFSDEMMVCNLNEDGTVTYNWSYVDDLFDFLQKVKIKPFVELGFMPSEIKASDETHFWWRANISGPREMVLWTDLVTEFIRHCINRYGFEEVAGWYFEVWNEPELEQVFWIGGKEAYFEFYRETAMAVKSVSGRLKVGGPAVTHQAGYETGWLADFLTYCRDNDAPLDFVSIHIYPEIFSLEGLSEERISEAMIAREKGDWSSILNLAATVKRIYQEKHYTLEVLESARERIKENLATPDRVELHVTEWNASAYSRNLIHDTCFVSAFIVSNVLKCIDKTASLGYWTFTDINEELKAGISAFHGGFGLITNQGLKKPSFYAYYLLSKLGDEIIEHGEDFFVTRKGDNIQILACNYIYFDDLFMRGDTSLLTPTDRYSVFEVKPDKEMALELRGIFGNYKATRYELNREHGSAFDEWVKMGHPESMNQEELAYLKGKARPKVTVEYLKLDGLYQEQLSIPVHGVELIVLEKQF